MPEPLAARPAPPLPLYLDEQAGTGLLTVWVIIYSESPERQGISVGSRNMILSADEKLQLIMDKFERRREPIPGEVDYGLPNLDVDFEPSKRKMVTPNSGFIFSSFTPRPIETNFKIDNLAREFDGDPEILLLHAYLVSHMRKRSQPDLAKALFVRMWKEESEYLLGALTPRWILSAVISFGVCGENENQRATGEAFNMFFSLMKLYEYERLFSGKKPDTSFELGRKVNASLPVGMSQFSLRKGDLDINTLARIYEIGCRDEVVRKPCEALVKMLLEDAGTIFSRISIMKTKASAAV